MNRTICAAAFVAGLAAVCWVGIGYFGGSPLALAMTALIGVVYLTGAIELLRFHRTTVALEAALDAIPENLSHPREWLGRLPLSLQNPVRLRLEGERVGLPAPALTPYLVGLLVLLGMLGTFLGMVVTLNGAVLALETTSDLPTIRAALAAPVKGLGFAFGTSVAGVAASAMLGLISALSRRARLHATQRLDTTIATSLRSFSLAHQRQETFAALQQQARALPEVVGTLMALMAQMERHSRVLNERLIAEQERFYSDAKEEHAKLAASVDRSLKESLTESARLAGETIRPAVEATMAGIANETAALQTGVASAVEMQLAGISDRFDSVVTKVADTWTTSLAKHERTSEILTTELREALQAFGSTFAERSASLLASAGKAADRLQAELAAKEDARQAVLTQALQAMASSLQREWQHAGERTLAQQEQLVRTLGETTRELVASSQVQAETTIDEVARLMETAAEAPRAAAEVIGELRRELSVSLVRDNELLAERTRILETLERVAGSFTESVETGSARIGDAADGIAGGAAEVASLGEAFGAGVQRFSESNDKLMATLARIEGALDKSTSRSDEQLAYYVAQAREIIDLSMMSQRQIVEDLQQISGRQASLAGEP